MSVMPYSFCSAYIDTDEGCEGWFEDVSPFRYKCGTCLEHDNQGIDNSGNLVQYDEDGNEVAA